MKKLFLAMFFTNSCQILNSKPTISKKKTGFLSQSKDLDFETLKLAVVHGTVLASFCVEGFGTSKMEKLNKETVEKRFKEFKKYTRY